MKAFSWRIAIAMLVGYLLGTVPQVILDPRLPSHVRYGARHYDLAWLIAPIASLVLIATLYTVLHAPRHLRLLTVVPFVAGCAMSAPIYWPELPHGNLLFVCIVWTLLAIVTLWIQGYEVIDPSSPEQRAHPQAEIDYLKEQIAFWKALGLALLAAYLGIIVTSVRELHVANTEFVKTDADRFLVNNYINLEMSIMSAFMFLGPLYESAHKVLATTEVRENDGA